MVLCVSLTLTVPHCDVDVFLYVLFQVYLLSLNKQVVYVAGHLVSPIIGG